MDRIASYEESSPLGWNTYALHPLTPPMKFTTSVWPACTASTKESLTPVLLYTVGDSVVAFTVVYGAGPLQSRGFAGHVASPTTRVGARRRKRRGSRVCFRRMFRGAGRNEE